MNFEEKFKKAKNDLLNEKTICQGNRDLFKQFFEDKEYKLKRKNNLSSLDEACYKTLYTYITRFRNVNLWFKNKLLKDLTEKDIKKVYDDLEDGKIKTYTGLKFKDRRGYYSKVFKSDLFKLAGLTSFANEAMKFYTSKSEENVRFITEEDFKKCPDYAIQEEHKLFLWLAWDIGENAGSLIKLKKRDCQKQINEFTKETEYLINLRKEILKRSRTPRSEITNYLETAELLSNLLEKRKDDELLFNFGLRQAEKLFSRVVNITKIKVKPSGDIPKLKDLRSSMACNLLKKGWSRDEVNARLGHKPSSREIDKYITYFAMDKTKLKKKLAEGSIESLRLELEERKQNEKISQMRFQALQKMITEHLNKDRNHIDNFEKITDILVRNKNKSSIEQVLKEISKECKITD